MACLRVPERPETHGSLDHMWLRVMIGGHWPLYQDVYAPAPPQLIWPQFSGSIALTLDQSQEASSCLGLSFCSCGHSPLPASNWILHQWSYEELVDWVVYYVEKDLTLSLLLKKLELSTKYSHSCFWQYWSGLQMPLLWYLKNWNNLFHHDLKSQSQICYFWQSVPTSWLGMSNDFFFFFTVRSSSVHGSYICRVDK